MKRIVLVACAALFLPACAGDFEPAVEEGPKYESFEAISEKLGCKSVEDSEPWDTSMKAAKSCNLGGESYLGLLEFEDAAKRDALLKSKSTGIASWLVLNDNFVVSGNTDDILAAHAKVGSGEIREGPGEDEPVPGDLEEPTEEPSEEPTEEEPTEEETEDPAKVVAFKKTVASKTEQVKVSKTDCGLAKLIKVVDNPDWDYLTDSEQYIDRKAPKGETWCVISVDWKNVGKKPMEFSQFGSILTTNGVEYSGDDYTSEASVLMNRANNSDWESGEQNPGRSQKIVLVYSVPKGSKLDYVQWGYDDSGLESVYTIALKVA
jgi:hypothetical protein